MKALFSLLIFFLYINNVSAFTLGIIEVDEPVSSTDSYLIFGSDGVVYKINQDKRDLVDLALIAQEEGHKVDVTLSSSAEAEDALGMINEIINIELVTNEKKAFEKKMEARDKDFSRINASISNTYVTNANSEADAVSMFATMRRGTRNRSQCYNRAHVWAWELNKKVYNDRKIQVGKIWLFFTRKYIREYRYKWWFHVSPFVDVNSELRVMDRKFTKGPLPEKTWTDIFIYSKQRCTEVYKYSDYRDHQFATHCYVIKSSLYYWQPYQVDNVERIDEGREEWYQGELRAAYRDAVGWRSRVP